MLKNIAHTTIIFTIAIGFFHFFFAWINSNVDSWFSWVLSWYFKTGEFVPNYGAHPYSFVPTGEPPLYSVLLALLQYVPRADISLHFIQIVTLGLTTLLLYKILKPMIGYEYAVIVSCIHALLPANLVFISYLMTDITAQLVLTVYIFILYLWTVTKKIHYLSLLTWFGFLSSLWKYAFLVYGIVALALFLWHKPKIHPKSYALPIIGLASIGAWIIIQTHITGIFGLSSTQSVRYHIQMVSVAKRLPPETDPSMIELRKYVPIGVDLYQPYWEMEPYFFKKIGFDWHTIDRVLGNVGLAAIKTYPIDFARLTVYNFFQSHRSGSPWWPNLQYTQDANPPSNIYPVNCDPLGKFTMCTPMIQTAHTYTTWKSYLQLSDWINLHIFPIWSVWIFFPSLLIGIVFGNVYMRLLSGIIILGKIPIAMFAYPDARYIMPFYPIMVLLSVNGILFMIRTVRRVTTKKTQNATHST